ncbi:urokinase plasminogen activator surface receptor-like isoform X2 [Siniperca chuatsi]|uniref:urokinase plasminogen activator surface receptor-like isoform X2 n=1 Tax=Siniperca chuatsi TaxID=119488 RepID=UPI001CE0B606|nr:urokinase plasminogen activator surface receptor-like isoform X2 [Siniperca chuatsi]
MMKLILSLTLIWALSSTAGALQCQTCLNVQCSSTVSVTCPSEASCVTAAATQVTSSGTTVQQIIKACAPSSLCPATDSQTFSFNFGVLSAVTSLKCCNTDNCNSGTLAFPAAQTNNSLQCFTCDPITSQCTTPLQCKGVEDRCFQANVTSVSGSFPIFGCVSAKLCAAATSQGSLPFISSVANFTSGPSCCGTSLCNTVTTTTAAPPTTTTISDACCIRLVMIHLLLGLLIFALC